ncbi:MULTISPECIES: extracellular solute-binding protein [Streptomyces]|uniref:ABC transporter substrate-binding protein n=1 Tax=Streptomyces viridochromogenes TaxID=1938 RepID=A0A0L8LDE6_STRVR|nr:MULTISPECIES: extracellular solute-binding protein [Streptomyces]KOG36165.1 ABC transporter substrate-binding protein [Streptomyces viridochromogenes]
MPQHRHALTAAATALVLCLTSAGCVDTSGEVTLRLVAADYEVAAGRSDSTERYWAEVVRAYESAHPGVNIEVEIVSWDHIDRQVADMVKAGEAPDMAQIASYAEFAERGDLYRVDSLLSIPVETNFLPALAEEGRYRGTQYGMPFTSSTRLLFYNEQAFDRAGIEKPPTTWAELKSAAQQLKDRTGIAYPMAVPLGPEEAQIEAMAWMLGGGGGYTGLNGSYEIDSQKNVDSLDWVKENLVKTGLTGPVPPERLNRKDAYSAFVRGEVGMVNGHPSLLQPARAAGIDVGKVPVPGRDGKSRAAPAVVDWIMAFKRNGHPREIGSFLDFLFSDENVREFAARNNLLPVTVSVTQQMEADDRHRDLREFLHELPTSVLPPVGKTSWGAVGDSTKRTIGSAMTDGGSPAKALRRIAGDASLAEQAHEE